MVTTFKSLPERDKAICQIYGETLRWGYHRESKNLDVKVLYYCEGDSVCEIMFADNKEVRTVSMASVVIPLSIQEGLSLLDKVAY